jgi:cytidylate kinase
MIIAIDGPAGTGKSTVAKGVAKVLGFFYFDTGAMYRSLAWHIQNQGVDVHEEAILKKTLQNFDFEIKTDPKTQEKSYFVNGINISHHIRTQHISQLASQIAILPLVRQALVKIQRQFGHHMDAVFEGRDMGTVVFPDAEIKIFLTATPEVRAERRYHDLVMKFPDLAESLQLDQLRREIEIRDHQDSTRIISPLKQAADAILIDTSHLTADEVIEHIVLLVRKRLLAKPALIEKMSRFWAFCLKHCASIWRYMVEKYFKKDVQKNGSYPRMELRKKSHHLSQKKMRSSYFLARLLALLFFRLFYRLQVYGLEHLHAGGGILAANHTSFFDPPVISVSCPEEVHFLARESLFRVPFLGRLIRALNSHPVARASSDVHTFRQLIQLLREGKKVILFPEGQRSPDGDLHPLEQGLSFLVYKAQATVYPVYVDGTFQAWNRSARFPRLLGHRIRCVFGSPIEWVEFEGLEKRQAMEQITLRTHRALNNLKSWITMGCIGYPP